MISCMKKPPIQFSRSYNPGAVPFSYKDGCNEFANGDKELNKGRMMALTGTLYDSFPLIS